jgi:arginyl-tRNA synthetase
MVAGKGLRTKPMDVASKVVAQIEIPSALISSVEVKQPGFVNFTLAPEAYDEKLREIAEYEDDEAYGFCDMGKGKLIQVEFVSANPTGPLNVVSARAAAVGDALVRLLRRIGYNARSEFYINDTGTQVELLGRSLKARFVELGGRPPEIPQGGYPGEYLIEVARGVQQLADWADGMAESEGSLGGNAACGEEKDRVKHFLTQEVESTADKEVNRLFDEYLDFIASLESKRMVMWPPLYVCHLSAQGHNLQAAMTRLMWIQRYRSFVGASAPGGEPASSDEPRPARACFLGSALPDVGFDFARFAVAEMVAGQRASLARFGARPEGGLTFDRWFHESALHDDLEAVSDTLVSDGRFVIEKDGAVWLRGGDVDDSDEWVIRRSTGQPTYFLSDITYHIDKRRRGFDRVIDIWGPDHHGHVSRMQTAMKVISDVIPDLAIGPGWLEVLIAQQVNLIRDGKRVQMSKRAGEYVTLDDVVEEVGADVARFFFLMRRCNSHLDFDLDLAKQTSDENPVYYVQYAHARICSIIQYAQDSGYTEIPPSRARLALLRTDEERDLMKALADFDDLVVGAAVALEPHRLAGYLIDLAGTFHKFYHNHRVVTDDRAMSEARLYLCCAVRTVLRSGLSLVGISAPTTM